MGAGRNHKRCSKRKFLGNQFVSEASDSAKTPAKEWDFSVNESPPPLPSSATHRKLSSTHPAWILDENDRSSFPYSNPDTANEDDSCPLSLSEEEFSDSSDEPCDVDLRQMPSGTRLTDFACLQALLSCMSVCKRCLEGELVLEEERRTGKARSWRMESP